MAAVGKAGGAWRHGRRIARVGASVLAMIAILAVRPASTPALANGCQFVLGFKVLHDLMPATVGDCLADESYDGSSGNAVQPTTGPDGRGGLLVWRRSDNLTAFTDGSHTWVDGPAGVQVRRNDVRFAWEGGTGGSSRTTPLFGVNAHPLQNVYAIYPPDQVAGRVAELGVSIVRIDVHWDWLEWDRPGVDQWDPGQVRWLNAFLDAAHQRNLQVMATVLDTPCWASSDGARVCDPTDVHYNWREPPANPADFGDFLARLATQYRGRIQYYEIWNEPNLPLIWTHPDPVTYTRLLQASYPAIKASDPTATVVGGSLAPIEVGAPGIDTFGFLEAMYAAGALGSFDALSFHPYTNGQSPTVDPPGWPVHDFTQVVPTLHLAMLRASDARPIWLTESGWPTTPSCADCGPLPSFTSEADQATYLAQEIRLVRGWPYVAGLMWYELFDRGPATATSPEDHFGLFRRDLSPKPAVAVFRALTRS